MSDAAPLLFRKVFGSLRPASKAAEEALAAMVDGPVRVRVTKASGNTRRLALYWTCLAIAAPMLSERMDDALDDKMLHRVLKKRRGLVKVIRLPSGDTLEDFDSVSFATMNEPERAAFIDWSLATVSKWLGCDVTDLIREGEAA